MNRMNDEIAWLRLQDTQREAGNRRLTSGRPSGTIAALKRLVARRAGVTRRSAPDSRQELA
jgi:hypothetical protein